ncbi:MAG: hypothetical protein WCO68_08945, partial [Verrucomicrobiota bacterium]
RLDAGKDSTPEKTRRRKSLDAGLQPAVSGFATSFSWWFPRNPTPQPASAGLLLETGEARHERL